MRKLVFGMLVGIVGLAVAGLSGCGQDVLNGCSEQSLFDKQLPADQKQSAAKNDSQLIWSSFADADIPLVQGIGGSDIQAMVGAPDTDEPQNQEIANTTGAFLAQSVRAENVSPENIDLISEVIGNTIENINAIPSADELVDSNINVNDVKGGFEIDETELPEFDEKVAVASAAKNQNDNLGSRQFESSTLSDLSLISANIKSQVSSVKNESVSVKQAQIKDVPGISPSMFGEIPLTAGAEVKIVAGEKEVVLPAASVESKPVAAVSASAAVSREFNELSDKFNSLSAEKTTAIKLPEIKLPEVSSLPKEPEAAPAAEEKVIAAVDAAAEKKIAGAFADTPVDYPSSEGLVGLNQFRQEPKEEVAPVREDVKAPAANTKVKVSAIEAHEPSLEELLIPEIAEKYTARKDADVVAVHEPVLSKAGVNDMVLPEIANDPVVDKVEGSSWQEQLLEMVEPAVFAANNTPESQQLEIDTAEEKAATKAHKEGRNEAGVMMSEDKAAENAVEKDALAQDAKLLNQAQAENDSEAEKLIKMEKIKKEARLVEARNNLRIGVEHFNAREYDAALKFFDKAVALDPELKDAVEFRNRTRQLVAKTPTGSGDAALLDEITRNRKARIRERELRINNSLEKAANLFLNAINPDPIRMKLSRHEQIKASLADLESAQKQLQTAQTLLKGAGLPGNSERTFSKRIKAQSAQISLASQDLINERAILDRKEAEVKVRSQQQSVEANRAKEIEQMFLAVNRFSSKGEYEKALTLLREIRAKDPTNEKANALIQEIRRQYHQERTADTDVELKNAEENWALDIQEAEIMPRKVLVYPLDWERIRQRARMQVRGGVVDFERQRLLNKLAAVKGTIEYQQLPLNMVLDDFRRRAKVNIMLNEEVNPDKEITITLRGLSLLVAFETILEANNLEFTVKDQAIEVFEKGTSGSSEIIFKIYQVADLTTKMKNYYAPKLKDENITEWSDDDDDDDDDEQWVATPSNLSQQIKDFVQPEEWSNNADTYSVELWENNLLVKCPPELHEQINKFLDDLRKSSKLQVLVEGRFMRITDDFDEEFGVNWTGVTSYMSTDRSQQVQQLLQIQPSTSAAANTNLVNTAGRVEGLQAQVLSIFSGSQQVLNNTFDYMLNNLQLTSVVNAAKKTEKGSVLHNPKVLVANGRSAYAQVISSTTYISSYTISGANVIPTLVDHAQGVTWEARPIISFDRKYVTIRLRPEISELSSVRLDTVNVTTTYGDSERLLWTINLQNPVMETTKFETNATVPDGGTIMVGGYLTDARNESMSGVPVLSSLPYAGRLFRTTYDHREGRNRVIMVTARIVELED